MRALPSSPAAARPPFEAPEALAAAFPPLPSKVPSAPAGQHEPEMRALLAKKAIPVAEDERGPMGIRHRGDMVGRGALTVDGLKSEIPKARAGDYLRSLS